MFENFLNVNLIILKSFINYSFDSFGKYKFTYYFALVPFHKATKTIDNVKAEIQPKIQDSTASNGIKGGMFNNYSLSLLGFFV